MSDEHNIAALLIEAADSLDPSCSDMKAMALATRLRDAAKKPAAPAWIACAIARASEYHIVTHILDPYEPSEETRVKRSTDAAARVLAYRSHAAHYLELAQSYESRAKEA
jgi:hypothetical protein